jgi:hypothetical protein
MRVLVCGGRNYSDYTCMSVFLQNYLSKEDILIHGKSRGADSLSEIVRTDLYGKDESKVIRFPADWERYRKRAGFIRNQQMLDEGKPDLVLAFPGGSGTLDMVTRARKAGVIVIECK